MANSASTKAIILSRVAYGDADWIVSFFSEEHGRMSGMARSARKSIKRFGSGLEPGALARVTYTVRSASALVYLEESQVLISTTGVMRSLERIEALAAALKLARAFLKEHQPAPEKFALFEEYLRCISAAEPTEALTLGFTLKWLALSGYEPMLTHCVSCGQAEVSDARFSPAHGGVVCGGCARGAHAGSVSFEVRRTLYDLMHQPLTADCVVAEGASMSALLTQYTTHVLGQDNMPHT